MIQFAVTLFMRLYAEAYKAIIFVIFVIFYLVNFLSFRAAYNLGWLTMKSGLHFVFLCFIERYR